MKYYPHPILAREGWFFIAISMLFTTFIYYLSNFWYAAPFLLISIFVIQFFRDPKRNIPQNTNVILSPADGKIISIEKCHNSYDNNELSLKISVFMNIFNVHSNRSPIDAKVVDIQYFSGKFINADFDKASTENERNAIILQMVNGNKLTVVQIAGLIARRILCHTTIGAILNRGQRFGFIRFGSRVDIYIPINATLNVSIGEKVYATTTILATLANQE